MSVPVDWTTIILAVAGLTAVTVLSRASFLLLPPSVELPSSVERALRYAPACALAAIVAPNILVENGRLDIAIDNYEMWAVIAGTAVFLRWRNMLTMMMVGVAVFTALRLLV